MIRSRKPREKKKKKKNPLYPQVSQNEAQYCHQRQRQCKSDLPSRAKALGFTDVGGSLIPVELVILSVLSCMQVFCLHLSWWDLFGFPVLLRSLNFGGLSGLCHLQVDSWFPYMIPYMPNVPAKNDIPQASPDPLCVWQADCLQSIWLESGGSSHSES